MSTVILYKTNEKINAWMFRNGHSQQFIADKIGITRQAFSQKMKLNAFTPRDLIIIKSLGYDGN